MKTYLLLVKKYPVLFFTFIICLILTVRLFQLSTWIQQDHFVKLASSFLSFRLDLIPPLAHQTAGDVSFFQDKYYVFFGPLPAILLMPLVPFLAQSTLQHSLGIFLTILDFWLLYKIARKFTLPNISFLLSIFFIFGTVFLFLSIINLTAYQTQVIATSFLIMSLYEFLHKKRWFLIGLFLAMAGITKPTLYLATIFFMVELLHSNFIKNEPLPSAGSGVSRKAGQVLSSVHPRSKLRGILAQNKLSNIFLLIAPILISILFLGIYNFLRFDNFLETGYSYPATMGIDLQDAAARGIFSFQHIPTNLYFLFFKGPDLIRNNEINYASSFPYLKANSWGMGIFFTSPLFLYIFLTRLKSQYVLSAWITVLVMLVPMLTYFGTGVSQYGYRYAVDFYPFLFLMLASVFQKNMPPLAKILIIYGILFNFFLMLSIWDIYPL